jgi:hypothetical protein
VNTVCMFFSVRTKKLPFRLLQERWPEAAGFAGLKYTHQPWSSPREEGLCYKWDEPRDPAALLADQTLWWCAAKTAHTGSAT